MLFRFSPILYHKSPKNLEMSKAELENAMKLLESSLTQMKWRLKYSSKRRLQIDILALCTRMRAVVLVDYGGKMPELQERLCTLLRLCQMGSPNFEHLKVMIIEDMVYLVHTKELSEHVMWSLNSETPMFFVDLEQDPPKMIAGAAESPLGRNLISIQKLFSGMFSHDDVSSDPLSTRQESSVPDSGSSTSELNTSLYSELIDLSSCMQETEITLPTLNGWLLGYPVVYLFGKEHMANAINNLSTQYLHLFRILVCRNDFPEEGSFKDELFSFSVPYDLSMGGKEEPWARSLLERMHKKWERCKEAWKSLHMEINEYAPQAIVL